MIFHRNAIITGHIDSYCLVCESHLRSEDDIISHIAKPIHSKNLEATVYLEKFKDDCVRKVKKGYYCEFCNILLSTAAKVGLHVVEEKHFNKKCSSGQFLRRIGNSIVFHNILINDKAWNGLMDETCAICNEEFGNEQIHKTETAHILNLVQNKVEFGSDKNIYRKIDEDSFQCITCNKMVALDTINTHFEDSQHNKLYQECMQAFINLNNNTEKDFQEPQVQKPKTPSPNIQEKPTPVKTEAKKPILFDFAPEKPNITQEPAKKEVKEVPVASVKKQTPVEFSKKTEIPSEAKKSERIKLEKVTVDLDEQICKALGAKDYITHDENGRKWCMLCDWTMDTVIIENHVSGRHHQTMLKLHKERLRNHKKSQELAETKDIKAEKDEKEDDSHEQDNKSKILDLVSLYQTNDININFVSNTALCKKCMKYLDFNCKSIESHIEEHKKAPPKKEVKPTPLTTTNQKLDDAKKTQAVNTQSERKAKLKRNDDEKTESRASSVASNKETDEEAEKFAKDNDLAYSRNDNKVYCRVCDSRVPFSLKNMKEHVAGLHHKNRVAKWFEVKQSAKTPVTIKKSMNDFIENLFAVDNGFLKDIVVNERYCINILSFLMISKMDRLVCEPCEMNISFAQLDDHKASQSHQKAMCDTPVIVSMESEFIREVRPDIFHCGYCNLVESGEDLPEHLGSTSHREAKTMGCWKLQQYLPELRLQQRRKEVEMMLLLNMLAGDLFS